MIVLTVLSHRGQPASGPAARFDERGGTIGRAEHNQLVLPDPERGISRVHARIVYRAGRYAIVDSGSNPIHVNGVPAGAGREQPLAAGDELQIGDYVLAVTMAAAHELADDALADIFDAPAPDLSLPAGDAAQAATGFDDTTGFLPDDWDGHRTGPWPRTAPQHTIIGHEHAPQPVLPAAPLARAQVPEPTPLPAGAVLSWDEPSAAGRVITVPEVRRTAAVPAEPAATSAAPAGADELLAALREGLDTPGLNLPGLTPETLRLLGQVLREAMRGTVELLAVRAALKRELGAELTAIVPRENNPLKFSPTVEVALNHLLGHPTPGFMAPVRAVRDAFDDLRAHQLGVTAGMRAALAGVLQRFDPAHLEAKLERRSALDSLIPASRKARLWELFQELYGQLQQEAEQDFDEIFGQAFLRAYDEQLDRLQREPGPG